MSSEQNEVPGQQAAGEARAVQQAGVPQAGALEPGLQQAAGGLSAGGLSAAQQAHGRQAGRMPWKQAAGGDAVFRRVAPLILWWIWVAFVILNLVQVVIPDHDYFSVELTAGLLAVTGVVYACALRPRVTADAEGISVFNPFRDHRVRWGALKGIYLGDSVELSCARPAPRKDKTIYCWALYSGRRSRARAQFRAQRHQDRVAGTSRRLAYEAAEPARQDFVQLMAAELGRRSAQARQRGAAEAVLESGWAWWPLAYLLAPAAILLSLVLAR